jgi:hypothetical protein
MFVLMAAGGGYWYLQGPDSPAPIDRPRPKPPVGAYAINTEKGRTDFRMETESGQFGLRTGSTALGDMPYGFPFYPGATLTDSIHIEGVSPTKGAMVRFTTRDRPGAVNGFYRRQARDARLRIVTDRAIGLADILAGMYPDGRDGGFQLSVRRTAAGLTEATLTTGFGLDVATPLPTGPDLEALNILEPPPEPAL